MKSALSIVWLVALSILAGCAEKETAPPEQKPAETQKHDEGQENLIKLSAEEARVAGIRVEKISMQTAPQRIVVTATIQANRDKLANVAPLVSGRVTAVTAKLGDVVKRGQILATVNSVEVGEARSAFATAQSELALAQANFERAQRLFKEQIVAQKDYLKARAELQQAQAGVRAARERLAVYGLSGGATRGASLVPVVAPISGTVIEKDAVIGELAGPDKSLFTIADLSTVWIEASLSERDLGKVAPGAAASVTVTAYPNETFHGRVTYLSSTVDADTRTVKARIEVPNPAARLKPNMFASAAIETASTAVTSMRVPNDAVVLLQGQPTVFVAKAAGFEPRAVQTGERSSTSTEIKSGIADAESVAVSGAYALKGRMLKSQIGDAH